MISHNLLFSIMDIVHIDIIHYTIQLNTIRVIQIYAKLRNIDRLTMASRIGVNGIIFAQSGRAKPFNEILKSITVMIQHKEHQSQICSLMIRTIQNALSKPRI